MDVGSPCSLPEKLLRIKEMLAIGAIASARPSTACIPIASPGSRLIAMAADANDQTRNQTVYDQRMPKRSTIRPAGIWNAGYVQKKAESSTPIVAGVMLKSFIIAGAATLRLPRSM